MFILVLFIQMNFFFTDNVDYYGVIQRRLQTQLLGWTRVAASWLLTVVLVRFPDQVTLSLIGNFLVAASDLEICALAPIPASRKDLSLIASDNCPIGFWEQCKYICTRIQSA